MAGTFTGSLQVDFGDWGADVGRIAITLAAIRWQDGNGVDVTIPAGTMTDGATVPRALWWFLPPWGDRATAGAVLHDFICERLDKKTCMAGCETRSRCDQQLYLALLALGVADWRARIVWAGVRVGSLAAGYRG